MPYFVGRELPQAGQGHLFEARVGYSPVGVGFHHALGDEEILSYAQGAQQHMSFDDLPGARVGYGAAVGPAAGGAVYPVDHIVAHVHGVCALGEYFYLKGVLIAGGFKCLVPPACPFYEGRADGFGCAAVEVVHDGFYGFAELGFRVFFFQSVAHDKAPYERLVYGGGIVGETHGVEAAAGVIGPGGILLVGEFDKGVVHAHCDRVGGRGDRADPGALRLSAERDACFKFAVFGKIFGVVEIYS